ncbi:MAG: trypsin-like peptidase domain-containing protein [Actinobacteria bacterium]|nr:trypsin-like peptidase domain-containing protein [Actinomycetota bacterium]
MRKTLLLCLVALLMSSCISFTPRTEDETTPAVTADLEQDDAPPPRSRTADVVERVLPSLVNVRVSGLSQSVLGEETKGQGSGVVIDADGVIVTNYHVVQDAVRVRIFFQDGHDPVDGKVVGTRSDNDLAVIKVPTTGLTPIEIGSSESLRLGDDVIALGFPLGLGGPTVTKGIVSGKNRKLEVPRDGSDGPLGFEGLLQTDAAINPGNSGGPLVDTVGRLVGINTAAAGAASAENVGFAIAIDTALPVIEEILAEPAEERAWLGVGIAVVDPLAADELGLDREQTGALITQTVSGAPAAEAGLEAGDVIVAIEGETVETPDDLTRILTDFDPGDTIAVEIVNADGTDTVEVTLAQRPVPPEE